MSTIGDFSEIEFVELIQDSMADCDLFTDEGLKVLYDLLHSNFGKDFTFNPTALIENYTEYEDIEDALDFLGLSYENSEFINGGLEDIRHNGNLACAFGYNGVIISNEKLIKTFDNKQTKTY